MKRHLLLAGILFGSLFCGSNAFAQFGYQNGYGFGSGLNFGFPMLGRGGFQREDIPYFAKFPPVYYSNIVRRPYGVSPFAAPPGIVPVEMGVSAVSREPLTIVNPFYTAPAVDGADMIPVESESSTTGLVPLIPPTESSDEQQKANEEGEVTAEGSVLDESASEELKDNQ
jgi:hypothetical protein